MSSTHLPVSLSVSLQMDTHRSGLVLELSDGRGGGCPHNPDCHANATLVQFYKDGEMKKEFCMYRIMRNVDVSQYDTMVIYPHAHVPFVEVRSKKISITERGRYFILRMDIRGIDSLDLQNKMWVQRTIERHDDLIGGLSLDESFFTSSDSSSSEEEMQHYVRLCNNDVSIFFEGVQRGCAMLRQ